jgi:hypothetical protein
LVSSKSSSVFPVLDIKNHYRTALIAASVRVPKPQPRAPKNR